MHFLRKNMLAIQKLGHLWLQKQMLIFQCLINTPPNVQEFNLKRQIMIQDHVNKYVNSLSTNKMKSDELISKKVHINLKIQTIHTMMILIVIDFNFRIGPPMYKFLATPLREMDKWINRIKERETEKFYFIFFFFSNRIQQTFEYW